MDDNQKQTQARRPFEMQRVIGQDLSRLWFGSQAPAVTPSGQWYVKGAIAFPRPVDTATGPDLVGAGLIAGICQDVMPRPVVILDEFTFRTTRTTLGHEVTGESSVVRDIGLTTCMRNAASTYGLRDWFTDATDQELYNAIADIRMDPMMTTRGAFHLIPAQIPADAMQAVSYVVQLQAQHMLFYPMNGVAWQAVNNFAVLWRGASKPIITPGMWALISLAWGFRMCPFKKKEVV